MWLWSSQQFFRIVAVFSRKPFVPTSSRSSACPHSLYRTTTRARSRAWSEDCRAKRGQNFVDLMLRLARERGRVRVVDNEFTSPTATADLARQIAALRCSELFGLYHATAEDSGSWYELPGTSSVWPMFR